MTLTAKPYNRHWAVYDKEDKLICVTVYKKGAAEVVNRFGECPEGVQEFDPILDEVVNYHHLNHRFQEAACPSSFRLAVGSTKDALKERTEDDWPVDVRVTNP